jgi:hypothetical protein
LKYRIRVGQVLSHKGTMYSEGQIVELDDRIAAEVSSKIDPCTAEGETVTLTPAEQLVANARQHEKISLLEAEKKRLQGALDDVQRQLTEERARVKPPSRALKPQKPQSRFVPARWP